MLHSVNKKTSTKEYIIANIVLGALCACLIIDGMAEIALLVLIPACLTYIFTYFNLKHAVLPLVLTVLVSSVVSGNVNLSVLMLDVPIAFMLRYAIIKKKSFLFTMSFAVFGELISFAIIAFVVYMAASSGVAAFDISQFQTMFDKSINAATELYQFPPESVLVIREMIIALLPSMLVSIMAAISYVIFYITTFVLKKCDSSYQHIHKPFSEIKADKSCVFAFVIFFIASLFTDGVISSTLVNIVMILGFFLFVCGASAITFFAKRVKNRVARIFVYVLIAFSMAFTSTMFMFVGFIDTFSNSRRANKSSDD